MSDEQAFTFIILILIAFGLYLYFEQKRTIAAWLEIASDSGHFNERDISIVHANNAQNVNGIVFLSVTLILSILSILLIPYSHPTLALYCAIVLPIEILLLILIVWRYRSYFPHISNV